MRPPAPALCPTGRKGSDGGRGSQREMCLAAGTDAATTRPPQVPRIGRAGAPRSPTRTRNLARGPKAVTAPMPGAGERLQSVPGSGGKRPPTGGRASSGGEWWGGQGHSPSPLVRAPSPVSWAPSEARRVRLKPGPHLRDGPLYHSPALHEGREHHEILNSWRTDGSRDSPGGWRRAESGLREAGECRKQES